MATKKEAAKPATKTAAKTPKAPKAAKGAKVAAKAPSGPKARLAAKHGTREALIKSLIGTLRTDAQDADALGTRLGKVSNAKLIRLANTVETVTKKYGSRAGLVDAIVKKQNRTKDKDYATKLASLPLPRLLDMTRTK